MNSSREIRDRLPNIDEITEEMILRIRDHGDGKSCKQCENNEGKYIGKMGVELYSIHYIDTIEVYGCENCYGIWYIHISRELA